MNYVATWNAPPRILPSAPVQPPKAHAPNHHVARWHAPPFIVPSAPVGNITGVREFSIMSRYERVSGMGGVGETIWSAASLAGTVMGAYHGYKRNDSVGWAIVWALLGGIAPIITIPVSIAQGFGEPKKG